MNFVLRMKELGVGCYGTVLLKFLPKCMNIMRLCMIYDVIVRTWVVGVYIVSKLCSYV